MPRAPTSQRGNIAMTSSAMRVLLPLACLAAAALTASAYTPKAKWGQDLDHIYLTISAACETGTSQVEISNSSFSFTCTPTGGGEPPLLAFQFRENIDYKNPNTTCRNLRIGACGASGAWMAL